VAFFYETDRVQKGPKVTKKVEQKQEEEDSWQLSLLDI
jgi:hypothetical protein